MGRRTPQTTLTVLALLLVALTGVNGAPRNLLHKARAPSPPNVVTVDPYDDSFWNQPPQSTQPPIDVGAVFNSIANTLNIPSWFSFPPVPPVQQLPAEVYSPAPTVHAATTVLSSPPPPPPPASSPPRPATPAVVHTAAAVLPSSSPPPASSPPPPVSSPPPPPPPPVNSPPPPRRVSSSPPPPAVQQAAATTAGTKDPSAAPTSALQGSDPLDLHNRYRAYNHARPMTWSNALQASAQKWADHLAATCGFSHSTTGENLAAGYASWEDALWGWYGEYRLYNFQNPSFSDATGHFTQMVWRSTTKLGCGMAQNSCHGAIYVCHYDPVGNYIGEFAQNVLAP